MTKPTGRPRGRPRKDPIAESDAAPKKTEKVEIPRSDDIDDGFIELKLLERDDPRRRTKLEADTDTLRSIFLLSKLFCTQEEAAGFLGVGRATFQRFLYDSSEAKAAWDDGQQHARISLRRKQFKLAEKLAPMAIFLGKNYLEQRDEKHQTTQVTHTVEELSEDKLLEIARQAMPEAEARPSLH